MEQEKSAGLIYEKIPAIMQELGPIAKNGENKFQRYNYLKIDDIYQSLNPLFSKHKVSATINVKEINAEKEGKNRISRIIMDVVLAAEDGSSQTITTAAEGSDTLDKSVVKAISAAFKYAMITKFMIQTGENIDIEHEPQQIEQVFNGTEVKPAPNKAPAKPKQTDPLAKAKRELTEKIKQKISECTTEELKFIGTAYTQKAEVKGKQFYTVWNGQSEAKKNEWIDALHEEFKATTKR